MVIAVKSALFKLIQQVRVDLLRLCAGQVFRDVQGNLTAQVVVLGLGGNAAVLAAIIPRTRNTI